MHEPDVSAVKDIREKFREFSEAERDFLVTEAELLARPLNRDSIAATTALVFGKLLAYLGAEKAFHHANASFMQQAFVGQERKGAAAVMVERLHRTIDRASAIEEEFRLEKISCRVLMADRADAPETTA